MGMTDLMFGPESAIQIRYW